MADIAMLTPGFAFKSKDFGDYRAKVIKITDVADGCSSSDLSGVDVDKYPTERMQKYRVVRGDYYLAMTGSIGKVGRLVHGCAYLNQRVLGIRPKEGVNRTYLWHLLNSTDFKNHLLTHIDSHSVQANISAKSVGSFKFELPSIEKQDVIASILGSIDKKIQINTKLNGYLEELLFAKYDKLFDANETFDGMLSDIGDVVGGATPSKKKPEYYCTDGIGWITPRDLSNTTDKFIAHGADDITGEGYASCSTRLLPKGSVLFSSRAPIGYVAIAADNVTTNQGFKSVVPHDGIGTAFVYCFLVRNKQRIADMGAGTTFPEVSGRMMKSVELAVPDYALCAELSSFATPLLRRQEMLERENRKLSSLRDVLLPKLMSGEIDVSKVDLTQLNSHLTAC